MPAMGRKSKRMAVSQRIFSESVSLSIRDNGRGFDPKRVIGEHLGLGIMQERALNAQVHLSIRSKPGHGTEIALRWPLLENQSSSER
jgi:two-component system nitrate/nitrite sensor histidine kinase NarX